MQPDGVAVEHGYAETVARLRNEEIRVFAIAPFIGACGRWTGRHAPTL